MTKNDHVSFFKFCPAVGWEDYAKLQKNIGKIPLNYFIYGLANLRKLSYYVIFATALVAVE